MTSYQTLGHVIALLVLCIEIVKMRTLHTEGGGGGVR